MEAQTMWQKNLLGDETQRGQESNRKWASSPRRFCKKALFSGSADVILPNSSIPTGSKNCPNLTRKKHEMKSYEQNCLLASKPNLPIIPLLNSTQSIQRFFCISGHCKRNYALFRKKNTVPSHSICWVVWTVGISWAGGKGNGSEIAWITGRIFPTGWVLWKSLCSWCCKEQVPVF